MEPLVAPIHAQFQAAAKAQAESEVAAGRRALESGEAGASLSHCDRAARLFAHLPTADRPQIEASASTLARQLVSIHGINIAAPEGHFVFGSLSRYVSEFVPSLTKALKSKGFLPPSESSPWRALWRDAPYQMRLTIREQQEGRYVSSANRLCRIEAHLTLLAGDQVSWQAIPTARSTVPLPRLPADVSSRVALTPERSAEFERMLYDDARGQIDEKFDYALRNMPVCPAASLVK